MNNDPKDEIRKPSPQSEPSLQPEAQPSPEVTPRDNFAPYIPLGENEEEQQDTGILLSRRATLGWLLAIGVIAGGGYSFVKSLKFQAWQTIQPSQPIVAAPLNPGCPLIESASAEITIEEYADFACPYCARFVGYLEEIKRDFGSRVRIVYHNLPRPAHGPIAETAARAFTAVCLQNPAVAYSYYSELLGHQNTLYTTGEPFLYEAASKYGIDIDRMKSDMASKTVLDRIEQDKVRAKQSGLVLSPSWIIGTRGINGTYGDYSVMKQIVSDQLSRK